MWTLILGAFGALLAIFLKEAAQSAIQRRVIAHQLAAYLVWWKGRICKSLPVFMVYQEVQKREVELGESASKGTQAFRNQFEKQTAKQIEIRNMIKEELAKAIENRKDAKTSALTKRLIQEAALFSENQRAYLLDSKTFISDRDAAILGKAFARNVVQFRVSMQYLLAAFEGILKSVAIESELAESAELAKVVAQLVDSIIISGEELVIAMIRLERDVDSLIKKTLLQCTVDILLGR